MEVQKQYAGAAEAYGKTVKGLKIILPHKRLQIRFASFVNKAENSKINLEQSLSIIEHLNNSLTQKAFTGELLSKDLKQQESTLSAFEDKPELEKAAIDAFNRILNKKFNAIPNVSESADINTKIKQLELERQISGHIPLDIDYLKHVLQKEFKNPFRAQTLINYLKKENIDFDYDEFVNSLFSLLGGKKSFLKQIYIEIDVHEMAMPIKDEIPGLTEAEKENGLYLKLTK